MLRASLNWRIWTGPVVTFRLSAALILSVLVFTAIAALDGQVTTQRWTIVAAMLGTFALVLFASQRMTGLAAEQRSASATVLMILCTVAAAIAVLPAPMTLLLILPALHAVLTLSGATLKFALLACALFWIGIGTFGNTIELSALLISCLELLPVTLVLLAVRALSGEVNVSRSKITALSYKDELSGLLNMRAFTRMLQTEHRRAEQAGTNYALLMVDIDGLQSFNEKHGHEQGNRVISAVADAIRRSTRRGDLVARYGGDEFMVYLPDASDAAAEAVANRIGQHVYNITLSFDRSMQRVNVNIGTAIYPDSGTDLQQMMSFADKAMYRDKEFKRSVKDKPSADKLRKQAGVEDFV